MDIHEIQTMLRVAFPTARVAAIAQLPKNFMRSRIKLPRPNQELEFMEVGMWEEGILDRDDDVDDACEFVSDLVQLNSDWRVVGVETAGREELGFMLNRIFFIRGKFESLSAEMEQWYEAQDEAEAAGMFDDDDDDDERAPWEEDVDKWKSA